MTLPKIKVFVDSDVIISSLISTRGAAHLLLHDRLNLTLTVADTQLPELKQVTKRLKLNPGRLNNLIDKKVKIIKPKKSDFTDAENLTTDPNDRHIAVGIVASKPKFFVSYNLRHFRIEKIKTDLKVICLTPAQLLQYLRGLN